MGALGGHPVEWGRHQLAAAGLYLAAAGRVKVGRGVARASQLTPPPIKCHPIPSVLPLQSDTRLPFLSGENIEFVLCHGFTS